VIRVRGARSTLISCATTLAVGFMARGSSGPW
jgi:hypothetical protein